ncbi:MAG: fused MFS/spermidine synthase, partial [Thermoleophilia bacterium]|nr:fused MFS/spermidine synthase [Thermoleophilia bacterium]
MNGLAARLLPYLLSFFSSFCIMILELMASRLVARHVGASLTVWTSVIGIMLGGICLGNVLGGRLADRVEPRRAIGPLYALGALLTLSCLWVNAIVGRTPGLETLPWDARTAVVVTLDFLIPATVLGMIGPVVAKMAVERARKAGTAIGDVYFWGAIGSIVGTFLAGFVLMYLAPVSSIVTIVGASLALLAAVMLGGAASFAIGLVAAAFLIASTIPQAVAMVPAPGLTVESLSLNAVALVGHGLTLLLGLVGLAKLLRARSDFKAEQASITDTSKMAAAAEGPGVRLSDLAMLSFIASLTFMALEMVAGRMLRRHLGS